jgi:hypothetical protein
MKAWALSVALLTALVLQPVPPAHAVEAPAPKPALTISGSVKTPVAFDMARLAALPQHSFTTRTPWHAGPRKFTGPLLRDVLALAGIQGQTAGQTIEAMALNDYKVTIPVEDAMRFDVVVARLIDDRPMAVRDKGPLFIIYPFDSNEALRNSIYYSRSAWQLKGLVIR